MDRNERCCHVTGLEDLGNSVPGIDIDKEAAFQPLAIASSFFYTRSNDT